MDDFYRLKIFQSAPELTQLTSFRNLTSLEQVLAASRTKNYLIAEQVHGNNIFLAENIPAPQHLSGYDGFITQQNNLTLIIKTADCAPVLLYDKKQKIIANLHAGRQGTELRIVEKALNIFFNQYGSHPEDILAAIGPAICADCYQIDRQTDLHYDLRAKNREQLLQAGILAENLEISPLCTCCNAQDKFFSYRRENEKIKRTFTLFHLL